MSIQDSTDADGTAQITRAFPPATPGEQRLARIVYLDSEGYEREVRVDPGVDVTIGRNSTNTICTANPTVSREHCIIRQTNEGFEIVDRGSSSGTFLNSYKITRQYLQHGDEVCCGRFPMMFYEDHIPDIPWPDALWGGPTGWLLFKDDQNNQRSLRFGMGNPHMTIGRQNDCTIQTSDSSVSRVHAEFLADGHFELKDLGSANGTRVNGQRLQPHQPHVLRSRESIQFGQGHTTMLFYEDAGVPILANRHAAPVHNPWSQPNASNPGFENHTRTGGDAFGYTPDNHDSLQTHKLQEENDELKTELDRLKRRNELLAEKLDDANRRLTRINKQDSEKEGDQRKLVINNLKQRRDELETINKAQERELIDIRTELRKKRDETEQLKYRVEVLQRDQNRDDSQMDVMLEENAALKGELEQLKIDFQEADRLANLREFELKQLRESMGDAPAGNQASGIFSANAAQFAESVDILNDIASQLRNSIRDLSTSSNDLRPVFDAYSHIDLQYLTSSERNAIESALRKNDPALLFEDIEMITQNCQQDVADLKDHILKLKDSL